MKKKEKKFLYRFIQLQVLTGIRNTCNLCRTLLLLTLFTDWSGNFCSLMATSTRFDSRRTKTYIPFWTFRFIANLKFVRLDCFNLYWQWYETLSDWGNRNDWKPLFLQILATPFADNYVEIWCTFTRYMF